MEAIEVDRELGTILGTNLGGTFADGLVTAGTAWHTLGIRIWPLTWARKAENPCLSRGFLPERTTGFEPATLTLAR